MATDTISRLRQAVKLAVVLLVVSPFLVQWGIVGADLVPAVSSALLVRAVGLTIVAVVLGLLVRQKRSSRGQRPSVDAPEQAGDRQVEASGRDEEIAAADRDVSGRR